MNSPLPGTAPPGPLLPAGNPRIVGIVNITEDSFSDGGRYLDPAAAVAHARKLRADGADIIELGPAASHPDSAPVSARGGTAAARPGPGAARRGRDSRLGGLVPARDPQVRRLRRRGLPQRHPRVRRPGPVPGPGGIAVPAGRHARRAGGRARHPGGDRPGSGPGRDPAGSSPGGWPRCRRPASAGTGSSSTRGWATSWAARPGPRWRPWPGSGS